MMESIDKLREWANKVKSSEPDINNVYPEDVARHCGETVIDNLDAIEDEIAEKYMELPCDCEGMPIFIGDLLKSDETNEQFMCRGYSVTLQPNNCKWWTVECSYDSYSGISEYVSAKSCRHVKPRTVEDVLADFAKDLTSDRTDSYEHRIERLGTKYADELREMLGSDVE